MLEVFSVFWALVPVTLAQSLILSFVVLGVMIPFRILSFPNLTSEGAYPLGGAVCAVALLAGVPAFLSIALAFTAGFLAGTLTAFIHLRFHIHTLLAGILVTTMLYSVNLRILGKPNIPLFREIKVFDYLAFPFLSINAGKILLAGLLGLLFVLTLRFWFNTERGIVMRAVGDNSDMAEAQGNNVNRSIFLGIGVAGGCSAFSGSLMVQSQSFVDVNMGLGILINALAALMIGEAITGRERLLKQLAAPFIGSIIYYQLISFCLAAGLAPSDLKIATGIFVIAMLAGPTLIQKRPVRMAHEKIRE
ncbi:MAG: hypothetical protein OXC68_06035 [Aestuariivita sp.]|nr:hypothetical protein [Aestuariivita sp.]